MSLLNYRCQIIHFSLTLQITTLCYIYIFIRNQHTIVRLLLTGIWPMYVYNTKPTYTEFMLNDSLNENLLALYYWGLLFFCCFFRSCFILGDLHIFFLLNVLSPRIFKKKMLPLSPKVNEDWVKTPAWESVNVLPGLLLSCIVCSPKPLK
jgi:hypothetical protein